MRELKLGWLALADAFGAIGMSFVWPLTTIYIHDRLGESLTTVGIVLLFYMLANVVGASVSGWLFDRMNPYWLTLGGITVSIVANIAMIFVHDWPAYPIGLVFIGFGSGWGLTMMNAFATTIHSRDGRVVYNTLYFAQNLGVVLGTSLVGFIYQLGIGTLFSVVTAINLLMWLTVAIQFRGAVPKRKQQAKVGNIKLPRANLKIIVTLLFAMVVIWVMYEQWISNLSVHMTALGISLRDYSLLWTYNAGLIVVFQLILTRAGHLFRNLYNQFYIGILFVALSFVLLIYANDYAHFVMAMTVLTAGEATAFPAVPAIVNELTPASMKGKYQGFANAWASVGKALGPLIGGVVIDRTSYTTLFIIAAVSIFLLLGICIVAVNANRHQSERY